MRWFAIVLALPTVAAAETVDDVFDAFGFGNGAVVAATVDKAITGLPRMMLCGPRMTDQACQAVKQEMVRLTLQDREGLDNAIKAHLSRHLGSPKGLTEALEVVRSNPEVFAGPACADFPQMDGRCGLLVDGIFSYLPTVVEQAQDTAQKRVDDWFVDD